MKAIVQRILAIPGLGPVRRQIYALVTATSSASQLSTRLAMRKLASAEERWRPIAEWNRSSLIDVATRANSSGVREFVFQLLVRRHNFVSALHVIDLGPRDSYTMATQLEALRSGYSATCGESSDAILSQLVEDKGREIARFPVKQFDAVCDSIRSSGLTFERKIEMLNTIKSESLGGPRLVKWLAADIDVRRRAGLEADGAQLVDGILRSTTVSDSDVDMLRALWPVAREAVSRARTTDFMKRALVSRGVTVRNLPFLLRELSDGDVLDVTTEDDLFRQLSDFPQVLNMRTYTPNGDLARAIVARGVHRWFGGSRGGAGRLFARSHPDIRNQVVGILCRTDRWQLLPGVKDIGRVSDTLLEIRFAEGLRKLVNDEHTEAAQIFESVLREHPDHKMSWLGLQWASVRATGNLSAIEDLRAEIGRGKASAGRPVVDQISAEETVITSRMWRGDFRRSPLSKVRPAWEAVAHTLGERFVDYDRALVPDSTKDLLVVPLNGVSDEVRDAYHYRELVGQFRSVTAVCDPRFVSLMTKSFPEISFVPFARRDKPLHIDDRRDDPITDVPSVLANFVPQSLRDLLCAESTVVTPGRNLSTQRLLAGELDLRDGGYLATQLSTPHKRLRVGVLWRSHVTTGFRGLMYLSLDELLPLFTVDGVDFVSLQHMTTTDEARLLAEHNVGVPEVDLFNDFDGTAELCSSLDLVIGISTLPTEIAAAVGTPVWLLGFSPENLFLRTLGGSREKDVLTANSSVIGPPAGTFAQTRTVAVNATIASTVERLTKLVKRS